MPALLRTQEPTIWVAGLPGVAIHGQKSYMDFKVTLGASVSIMDRTAVLRMDMGFLLGIVRGPLMKLLHRIHVLGPCNKY